MVSVGVWVAVAVAVVVAVVVGVGVWVVVVVAVAVAVAVVVGVDMNYEDKYCYVIFKYNVYDVNFYILHISELPPTGGFSSLYRFTKETAEALEEAGIAGYKGAVWSPCLFLDFDSEEATLEARGRLQSLGLGFNEYSTGNRGAHFEVYRPHSPSHSLPQLDKEWVISNFPEADTSIYSHLHMFRLEGTIHSKTGKSKKYLSFCYGESLILRDSIESVPFNYQDKYKCPEESIFLNHYIMAMTVPHEEGKRHESLLNLGMALKRHGEPIEFISRWLYHTNLTFSEPKTNSELERIISFVHEAQLE